jgi:tetratricopeptide (TPR) repeat protein
MCEQYARDPSMRLYDTARGLMDEKRLEDALESFHKSFALCPHAKTLELMGECHAALGRQIDAVIALAAATSFGRHERPPMLLARMLRESGHLQAALEFARMAATRNPGNRACRRLVEEIEVQLGRKASPPQPT